MVDVNAFTVWQGRDAPPPSVIGMPPIGAMLPILRWKSN